jgi:hypothetical protein
VANTIGEIEMPLYVGLDVSQKTTAVCVVDQQGARHWRGACATELSAIASLVLRHAGADAKVGVETGSMARWVFAPLLSYPDSSGQVVRAAPLRRGLDRGEMASMSASPSARRVSPDGGWLRMPSAVSRKFSIVWGRTQKDFQNCAWSSPPSCVAKRTELDHPAAHRFPADLDAALGQPLFDVPDAQRESEI